MKRLIAAALAAASVGGTMGGTMLVAAPAFATVKPVKLMVKPRVIHNGDATAITGKCLSPLARVRITSPALGIDTFGHAGQKLKVQFDAGWGLHPGKYTIKAQCYTLVFPGFSTTKTLKVKHAKPPEPPVPPKPPKPPVPPKPPHPVIPDFKPDVVIHTGFGGMARSVADHHPVR